MQTSDDFTASCRQFCIKDGFTEPHHPHQNPAENQTIKWIKYHAQIVLNATRAPEFVWTDCVKWITNIHNITANEALGYRIPYEKRHGSTSDISAFIIFLFWEPILYLEANNSFPGSKELPGRFLGVSKNVGDALTFVILSQEGTRIQCSVIRSVTGKPPAGFPNMQITHDSLTNTTNPKTSALLRLTSTPSTNMSVQVDEHNGGANDGCLEILALPAPENSTKISYSEN